MAGRLTYRNPRQGFGFAPWLDEAKGGASGVYVFRETHGRRRVLYVGESHTGRLYKTITRHFWSWRDRHVRRHYTVGVLSSVELAVIILPASRAVSEQNRLIARLRPEHNGTNPDGDEVPF